MKKVEFCLRAFFLENFSFFCVLLSPLGTGHFSYRRSVNDKIDLQSIEAQ